VDRPSPTGSESALQTGARVLSFVVLFTAGVVALIAGTELVTTAARRRVALWHLVPVPAASGPRVLALLVALLFFAAVIALLVRARTDRLELQVDGGVVTVPIADVGHALDEALAVHPDVLATRCTLRARGGRIQAEVWVAARPLTDAAALEPALRATAERRLESVLGVPCEIRRLRTVVVGVRRLPAYLPGP